MSGLWILLGKVLFWLAWLPQLVVFRRQKRTRVLVDCEGEILVVKGWMSEGKYSLPGGGLKFGEDPTLGAIRELREETGIELAKKDLNGGQLAIQDAHKLRFEYYQYFAVQKTKPQTTPQKLEISEVAWKRPSELNERNAEPNVLDTIRAWQSKR